MASDDRTTFITLFVAGMAIAPLASFLSRKVFKGPSASEGKRLEFIALASLPIMLAGFYFGWQHIEDSPALAIPLVACGVGLRYLLFPIMFGRAAFVGLGLAFIGTGLAGLAVGDLPAGKIALGLGMVELAVGAMLCRRWAQEHRAGA